MKMSALLEYVHFAEKLTMHAQTEEQVLYPAAILVGEYLSSNPRPESDYQGDFS